MDKKVLLIVFCICLSLFLVLFSYKVVFAFTSYDVEQEKVVDFLDSGDSGVEMTSDEVSHLEDVKGVMGMASYVFYLLLLVCTLIVTFNYKDKKCLGKLFFYGGIVGFGLVVLFLLFVLFGFDWLFTLFHEVFFPSGNWMFSGGFLIEAFPMDFFISVVWKIILLSLFLASLFICGGIYLKHDKR
jgi:integral membrane protein (TIGR01906 family)